MSRKGRKDRGLFERPAGSGTYWIRYAGSDGREHMERGGTKSEARALYMRRRTEIHDGTWQSPRERRATRSGVIDSAAGRAPLTLGAFARAWLEERAPHLTEPVRYDYRLLLNSHLHRHALASKPLAEVDDGDISRVIKLISESKGRRGERLSPRRINMVIGRLRTIFATAHRRKLIADDPMKYVKNLREPKSDVDPFDLDEALRIVEAARDSDRAFLSVLLFTGVPVQNLNPDVLVMQPTQN